jgi:hypothetical protein
MIAKDQTLPICGTLLCSLKSGKDREKSFKYFRGLKPNEKISKFKIPNEDISNVCNTEM